MLTTRLWMGTLLIILVTGVLIFDQYLAPVYPFLWMFQITLAFIGMLELIDLLGPGRRPQLVTTIGGVLLMITINWPANWLSSEHPWAVVFGCFTALILAIFLWEMLTFQEPAHCMERMGRTLLIIIYLGLLPSFLSQLRWSGEVKGSVAIALAIFVPKGCDIGAYFTGRLLGRHPMTPVLSPKKTWEGAVGGLTTAAVVAIGIDQLVPLEVCVLRRSLLLEIGFGISVGALAMLGDLAESMLKRDCLQKDASQVVPGFGGVLDVVDSVVFSAPLAYLWLGVIVR